ncbi:MAG: hypothetical protein NZ959_07350 [Armatimonadetes bacterium]|nr:hypothetical protein [Armatimonadota bacterium]MDW8122286.1 hypothetical protein [Armatimonadota bacterium]
MLSTTRRIAIVGAGADVGRTIVYFLVSSPLLRPDDELVLIGRRGGKSAFIVRGLEEDLSEGLLGSGIRFRSSSDLSEAWGDVVILVASTPDPSHFNQIFHRERLAQDNAVIFRHLAQELTPLGPQIGAIVIVTNPNELGVWLFSQIFPDKPVVGIGALVDTYRFLLEVARELKVPPDQVTGWVGGEHGPLPVFFRSTLRLQDQPLADDQVNRLLCPSMEVFACLRKEALDRVSAVLAKQGLGAAYEVLNRYPADVRSTVKSYLTHTSGAKTGAVASRAVLSTIESLWSDEPRILSLQTRSFYGTVGLPVLISRHGVRPVPDILTESERDLLKQVGRRVSEKINDLVTKVYRSTL